MTDAPRPPGTAHGDEAGDGVDLRAAEYVLGLLDDAARREARTRMEREPAFAAEVAHWEARFAPWLQAIPPAPVPASAWPRIQATLWPPALPARTRTTSGGVPSLLQSLAFWRGATAAGFAIAAAAVVLLVRGPAPVPTAGPAPVANVPPPAPAPAAPMVVALRHADGSTAYTATVDAATGTIVLMPVHLGGDQSLSPELWLIPAGQAPRSLGMLPRDKPMAMTLPATLRAAARDGLFAITLEPAGSGPHQAPTGEVIAKGSSIRL